MDRLERLESKLSCRSAKVAVAKLSDQELRAIRRRLMNEAREMESPREPVSANWAAA
jgi:hypothetical protein